MKSTKWAMLVTSGNIILCVVHATIGNYAVVLINIIGTIGGIVWYKSAKEKQSQHDVKEVEE